MYTDNVDVMVVGSKHLGTFYGLENAGFEIVKVNDNTKEIFVIADKNKLTPENIISANEGCIIMIEYRLRVKWI